MKLLSKIFNVILITFSITSICLGQGISTIVVDAGHGGKDPGASYGKLLEKNINLDVALKLGKLIETSAPHLKVVYTRKDDSFIELHQRSAIANKAQADLFISIHTNSSRNSAASGADTYIMGIDKSGDNLSVAMRENEVISYESDFSEKYEGYDPQSSESLIMFSMMQYGYQTKSLEFASSVQKSYMAKKAINRDRGVRQAGFLVLWRCAMPSVLTEIGFISNIEDRKYLSSEEGRKKVALSIFEALQDYLKQNQKTVEKPKAAIPQKEKSKKEGPLMDNNLIFRIQVKSSKAPMIINSRNFAQYITVVEEVEKEKIYKYYIEKLKSYKEALLLHQKIKKTFPDAFIVAFMDGVQIALDKAIKLEK